MGKAKRRSLKLCINDKFPYMTREDALISVVNNIENKQDAADIITLFGFTAEEMLEAGATYEDVLSFGGIIK